MNESSTDFNFKKDPSAINTLTLAGLKIYIVISFIVLVGTILSASDNTNGFAETADLFGIAGSIIYFVLFLAWLYRTSLNCSNFVHNDQMRFSPGWCVAYYFIPLVNLWRPYQCMKEIAQVSTNPHAFKSVRIEYASTLYFWWLTSIASRIVIYLANKTALNVGISEEIYILYAIGEVAGLISLIAELLIIKKIIDAQNKLVHAGNPQQSPNLL